MVTTTNKGYELQANGVNVNTWGQVLNTDVFTRIDDNLGGVTNKSLTNIQVDLNAAESRTLRLGLNGTLTGNVLVTTQAIGMTIIENTCTGNFTVTFQKNGVGTPVAIPNGTNALVTTGASGNPQTIGNDFPAGTRMLFQQTTPPPGWSKDTSTSGLNNSSPRLVTGSVSSGGIYDFTAVFAAARVNGGTVGNTALSIAQLPSHAHGVEVRFNGADGDDIAKGTTVAGTSGTQSTSSVGSGDTHTHSFTPTNMDFNVRFFDFVVGVRI